ncbi:MFS transporter [Streptomyces sp. NBC_01497]|uniref:MFS transporter n=1 Tax=Streptomyces sp. NBC_01497 TaxID=2903885 RepID=UPI002E32BF4C|nr:MFS transporter [Streptomyces sp. NBC_01497]
MKLSYMRELDEYPTGGRRMRILGMAVLAVLIGSYEGQIAPVVPLMLKDLHMSLSTYGTVSALATIAGALASVIGGRLTDTVGRVRLLIPFMLLTTVCCVLMTTVHSPTQLLLVRIALSVIDGMSLAGTAPIVRDFSPRMGRAQAFGFWTWGPVGANFLAAAIASATLPLFHDSWRSQFVIMGAVSLIASLVIAFNIADLSPRLRGRIRQTEHQALATSERADPPRARELLAHRTIWAHVVGIALWLVLYLTLSLYGPTMLGESFDLSASTASGVMSVFWVLNLLTVVASGRISDRLQLRKPLCVFGTLATAVVTGYLLILMHRQDVSPAHVMITGALLGGAMGVSYGPWMANFSEDAEDIDARLQGSAWGLFGFTSKAVAVLVLFAVPRVVGHAGWHLWMVISLGCMALFLPASLLFHGPWRRTSPLPATTGAAAPEPGASD